MKVAVIFGGKSPEHEVSRHSAVHVLNWLDKNKYDVVKIGITKEGRWYRTKADYEEIADGTWEFRVDNRQVCFPCDPVVHGLLVFDDTDHAKVVHIDCAIPVLHGAHGEDGDIQGLLKLSEIPFVGSGVAASANCMDKSITKKLAAQTGVRMADYFVLGKHEYDVDPAAALVKVEEYHGGRLPLFVKPSSVGSSVGAARVDTIEQLEPAIKEAFKYDDKVLIEEMIKGREMEIAVLGNEEPVATDVGEILSAGDFYDYDSKYNNPDSKTEVVTDLPKETLDRMRDYAVKLFQALGCKGLARVDFFYSDKDEIVFNEINTLPGFTDISMYPKLWAHMGVKGNELMDRLIQLAMEEHPDW